MFKVKCEAGKDRTVIFIYLEDCTKCSWSPHQLLLNINTILCRYKLFDSTDGHCLQTWQPISTLPTYPNDSFFKISLPWNLFLLEPRRVELISCYQGLPLPSWNRKCFLWTLTWHNSQSVTAWHSPHPGPSRLDSSIALSMESPAPPQCSTTCQEKKPNNNKKTSLCKWTKQIHAELKVG